MATRAGTIELLLKAETSRFQTQMLGAERRLAGFNAKTLAAGAALVAVGSAVQSSVSQFAAFEKELARAATKVSAGREELEQLRAAAERAGTRTQFTMTEAATAMKSLGQAGLTASEQVKALPAVLDFATASVISTEKAASIATTVMRGFGKEASQVRDILDTMTKAAKSANTDVSQMSQAMSFAAPVANSLGVSLEETAAFMGTLSDAGLQAGRAGRATRNIMFDIKEAANEMGFQLKDGAFQAHGLAGAFRALQKAGLEAGDAQDVFNKRTAAAAEIIMEKGVGAIEELEKKLRNSTGETRRVASKIRRTLTEQFALLSGDIAKIAIQIGEAIKKGLNLGQRIRDIRKFIDILENLTKKTPGGGGVGVNMPFPFNLVQQANNASESLIGRPPDFFDSFSEGLRKIERLTSIQLDRGEKNRMREFLKTLDRERLRTIQAKGPERAQQLAREQLFLRDLTRGEGTEKDKPFDFSDIFAPKQEDIDPAKQAKEKAKARAKAENMLISRAEELAEKLNITQEAAKKVIKSEEGLEDQSKKTAENIDKVAQATKRLGVMASATVGNLVSTIGELTDKKSLQVAGAALGGAGRGVQTGLRASQMATKAGGALAAASGPIGVGLGLAAAAPPILNAIFGGREEDRREKRRKRRARRRRERREFREQLAEDVSESFADEMERRQLMSQVFEIDARGAVGGTRQQIGRDIVSVIEDELSLSGNSGLGGGT